MHVRHVAYSAWRQPNCIHAQRVTARRRLRRHIFNFLFARIDEAIDKRLRQANLMTKVSWDGRRAFEKDDGTVGAVELELPKASFVDDLTLVIYTDAQSLTNEAGDAATIVIDELTEHGLGCNTKAGKSEAIVVHHGKGSQSISKNF